MIKKWLKNLEFLVFKTLLKRYCNYGLDQFDRWKVDTKFGKVYIQIDRQGDQYNYDQLK